MVTGISNRVSIELTSRARATAVTAPERGRLQGVDMTDAIEDWRPIAGYEGLYEVSDLGRVRSLDRTVQSKTGYFRFYKGRVLSPSIDRDGYAHYGLSRDGRKHFRMVHAIVCEAWFGTRPPDHQTRHLNGDNTDNRPVNLAWGTGSENEHDRIRHGTHPQASKTHCPRNHEYTPENTAYSQRPSGGRYRYCRECKRIRNRTDRLRHAGYGVPK